MPRSILTAVLGLAVGCAAWAQTADPSLTFEVATIKAAVPPAMGGDGKRMIRVGVQGGPGSSDPGQITYSFTNIRQLITQAFSLKSYQVSGPAWLDSEHFDIVAKVAKGATKDDVKVMLQNLLKERFHLAYHHEQKEQGVYALVVAKNGPKMKESADQSDPSTAPAIPVPDGGPAAGGAPPPPPPPDFGKLKQGSDGMPVMPAGVMRPGNISNMMVMSPAGMRAKLTGAQVTLTQLTDNLSNQVDKPLIDATGLTHRYDFTLDFAPDLNIMQAKMGLPVMAGAPMGGGGAGPAPAGASAGGGGPEVDANALPSALQSQLGLKLEQRKAPVDFLVVDHVEKTATEN